MNMKEYLLVGDAARLLGATSNTLRNWERQKKITSYRHPINNYRLYKKEDIESILATIEQTKKKCERK